jgi:TIR domain-containing protein
MIKAFVSYAGTDRERADELHQWLVTEGHEVFLAHDLRDGIVAGEQWRLRLYEKLRWADAVVCVLTRAYVASPWCTAEVVIAQSRGSRLIPILDEPKVVHPLLSDVQHIDRTRNPVAAYAALAGALRRVDAGGGFGWTDDQSPFPGCSRSVLSSIGCSSAEVRRPRSLLSCCDPPPNKPKRRCCWWWALPGAANRRWSGPDCCT